MSFENIMLKEEESTQRTHIIWFIKKNVDFPFLDISYKMSRMGKFTVVLSIALTFLQFLESSTTEV